MVQGHKEKEESGEEKKANNQREPAQKFLLRATPAAQGSSRGGSLKARGCLAASLKRER